MNRGGDRQVIFRDATDFERFLEILPRLEKSIRGAFTLIAQ